MALRDNLQFDCGPVNLNVSLGDLLQAPEDSFAVDVDVTLDPLGGWLARLVDQLGSSIVGELRSAAAEKPPRPGAVLTLPHPSGNGRFLFFVITSPAPGKAPTPLDIRSSMRALLEAAKNKHVASLAMTTLGDHRDHKNNGIQADEIFTTMIRYVTSPSYFGWMQGLRVVAEADSAFTIFCQRARGCISAAREQGISMDKKTPAIETAMPRASLEIHALEPANPEPLSAGRDAAPAPAAAPTRVAIIALESSPVLGLIASSCPTIQATRVDSLDQAYRFLPDIRPEVILLDEERLYLGDHLEVFSKLRQSAGRDVGSILHAEGHRLDSLVDAVEKGIDTFLLKPPHPSSIRQAVIAAQEKMKLRAAQRKLLEDLENLSKMQESFLQMVSHDLRNPLNIALNSADLLKDALKLEGKPLSWIQALETSLNGITILVKDLTDLSAMQAGKLKIQTEPSDPAELLARVAESFELLAQKAGVQFRRDFPPTLPQAALDVNRLRQVLMNLLGNSLKHTPAGREISLSSAVEQGWVVLRVADTGNGIEPKELPRIFEPFFQSATAAANKVEGMGLGLSICNGIVVSHGGNIKAHSDGLGKGTSVEVRIPLLAPSAAS